MTWVSSRTFRRLQLETGKVITVKKKCNLFTQSSENLAIYFNLILWTGSDKRQRCEKVKNNEKEVEDKEQDRERGRIV